MYRGDKRNNPGWDKRKGKNMIAIGCDHGGYELKEMVVAHLQKNGYEVKDVGCYSKDSVDYPAMGHAVGKAVAAGECEKGIVICTTGIGISISANKRRPGQGKLEIEYYNDGDLEILLKQICGNNIFNED